MELLRGGDLLSAVSKRGDRGVGAGRVAGDARALLPMSHVHERCIAHGPGREPAPRGARVSTGRRWRISGSREGRRRAGSSRRSAAPPRTSREEVILGRPPAVDMWACGVIMYALLTGELPFTSESERETQKIIRVDAGSHGRGRSPRRRSTSSSNSSSWTPCAVSPRGARARVVRDSDRRRVHGLGVSPIRRRPGIASQPSHRQARARDVARRATRRAPGAARRTIRSAARVRRGRDALFAGRPRGG